MPPFVEEKIETGQPHLVQLVVLSKKALQHGEQLCSRARSISVDSAQAAVDVLSFDAKVRWINNAVTEQLKVMHARNVFHEVWCLSTFFQASYINSEDDRVEEGTNGK
jgi:hypothetical protein